MKYMEAFAVNNQMVIEIFRYVRRICYAVMGELCLQSL